MKKSRFKWWIIAATGVLAIWVYGWIPGTIKVSRAARIPNNIHGIYRNLSDTGRWHQWWTGSAFELSGNHYSLDAVTPNALLVGIRQPLFSAPSSILLVADSTHQTRVQWSAAISASLNPLTRIRQYFAAQSLAGDLQTLLNAMQGWYSDTTHLYDLAIRRERVNDSLLVFIQDSASVYPSVQKIYSLVDELRTYIVRQGAQVTDSPMLNVYSTDSTWFLTRVALPTNQRLEGDERIRFKWMLGGGNILEADVTGDDRAAKRAMESVEKYMQDHNLQAPAIPFFSLLSNRLAEKDSTRWKTRIYYPVMYYYD